MDVMNSTTVGGVALRDSSLLTTAERNERAERARAAARRQRERGMQERLDLLEAQINTTARRRLEAWAQAARTEQGAERVTAPLAERLEDLYEVKRRLLDPRTLL